MPSVVAASYLAFGALWIFLSDRSLSHAGLAPEDVSWLQTYKGWFFVLVSAALLYALLRTYAARYRSALMQLQQSEQRCRRSEEVAQLISRTTNDAIWDRNLQTGVITWSDGLQRLFGYDPAAPTDFAWFLERVHAEDRSRVAATADQAIRTGGAFTQRYRFQRHSSGYADIVERGYAFKDIDGSVTRLVAGMSDISVLVESENHVRQINEELERRVQARTLQLEAANRELESFAYAVSHDLRAPLRAMSGFSQALLEIDISHTDPKAEHYLRRILEASRKMAELIESLLSLSRLSRAEMHRRELDLSEQFAEATQAVRERYPQRSVAVNIQPGMKVSADNRLLKIALENLLDNAWKYTSHAAAPAVEIGETLLSGERVFFVRDNGVGFNMAYAGKLFTPFQRLHAETEFAGSGIGLVTVQRILARHGGRIWAQAAPDEGATFYFTLP